MTNPEHSQGPQPTPMSPGRRRAGLAALLIVTLATSIGHGSSGGIDDLIKVVTDPDGCVGGSLVITPKGDGQTGYVGAPAGRTLALELSCRSENNGGQIYPFDYPTQWRVVSGGGSVNAKTEFAATNATGVNWQLGTVVGTQVVAVTIDRQTITFTATALPASPPSAGCDDLVESTGTNFDAQRFVIGDEHWPIEGSPYRGDAVYVQGGAVLTIDPGVRVCLGTVHVIDGRVMALGTAVAPITFDARGGDSVGLLFGSNAPQSPRSASELRHVLAPRFASIRADDHALRIEDSVFRRDPALREVSQACRSLHIITGRAGVPPSSFLRSTFDGLGGEFFYCTNSAALVIEESSAALAPGSVFASRIINAVGVGVHVVRTGSTPGWRFQDCAIERSGAEGLRLDANVQGVHGCAFTANVGTAVVNTQPAAFTVPAAGNWWGAPGGAGAAGGGGASGGVDTSAPLGAPPTLGY